MIPPAATTGTEPSDTTAGTSSVNGNDDGSSATRKVPRCPPASGPCTTSTSAPCATASRASSTLVTVTAVEVPRPAKQSSTHGPGVPNQNDSTSETRRNKTSNLAGQQAASQDG